MEPSTPVLHQGMNKCAAAGGFCETKPPIGGIVQGVARVLAADSELERAGGAHAVASLAGSDRETRRQAYWLAPTSSRHRPRYDDSGIVRLGQAGVNGSYLTATCGVRWHAADRAATAL